MSLESGSQPSANDSNPRREVTGDVTSESYYSSNFKEILRECLSPSNPDHHVISSDAVSVVERFRCLSGRNSIDLHRCNVSVWLNQTYTRSGCTMDHGPDYINTYYIMHMHHDMSHAS